MCTATLQLICVIFLLPSPIHRTDLDLDGDTDRDGQIRFSLEEEAAEETSSIIVLVNCDHDDERSDANPDNHDSEVKSAKDWQDLEPVVLRKNDDLPVEDIVLKLTIHSADSLPLDSRIRIFDRRGNEVIGPNTSDEYLLSGVDRARLQIEDLLFYAEGLQFRTSVKLSVLVDGVEHDVVILETPPFILMPHDLSASDVFAVQATHVEMVDASKLFIRNMKRNARLSGVKLRKMVDEWDLWIEDEFCWGFTSTPRHTMPVVLQMHRQYGFGIPTNLFDDAVDLLKPDVGYFKAFDYPVTSTNLDVGGNVEVTPATDDYPFGRIYYGSKKSTDTDFPYILRELDQGFQEFFKRQQVQEPIDLTTDWLRVGHVDELVSFVPKKRGGFHLLIASPELGWETIMRLSDDHELDCKYRDAYKISTVGDLRLKRCFKMSIEAYNDVIDKKLFGSDHSNPAPGSVKRIFMDELGLTEADIVEVPIVFHQHSYVEDKFAAVALTPSIVNLVSLGQLAILPDPFIPQFRDVVQNSFDVDHDALWIDCWSLYHIELGEVHCGSNELRIPYDTTQPTWQWWKH